MTNFLLYSERKNPGIHAGDEASSQTRQATFDVANFERGRENHSLQAVGIYILCVAILGLALAWRITADQPQKIARNQEITLVATISTQPKISERSQIIAVGDSRLFVPLYPRFKVADRLRIEGVVDEEGRIFNAKVEKTGGVASTWSLVAGLRSRIEANINQLLPSREAALVGGMVLGVDSIEREFRDQLIKTGTIHVVVVSGQNLSIVAGLFLSGAGFIPRRLSLLMAVVAVFAYALLTGFEPPVVRASLMVLFSSIAIYFGREKIALWSLILAALIILFFWPQALLEISFQLTFAATLGIITLGLAIQNLAAKRLRRSSLIVDSVCANGAIAISAYIFTAPIILFYFSRISPIAPLVNILVAELVSPIMILGFLIAGTSLIFMPLAQIFAYLAYVPATIFVAIINIFS